MWLSRWTRSSRSEWSLPELEGSRRIAVWATFGTAKTRAPAAIVVPTPWKAQILPERPRETWGLAKPSMHRGLRPTTSTKLLVLGRTLEIYRGDPPLVVVGDQVVLRSEGYGFVSVQGIYEADARAYVLVQENTGGRLCPATYRILEIAEGPPRVWLLYG